MPGKLGKYRVCGKPLSYYWEEYSRPLVIIMATYGITYFLSLLIRGISGFLGFVQFVVIFVFLIQIIVKILREFERFEYSIFCRCAVESAIIGLGFAIVDSVVLFLFYILHGQFGAAFKNLISFLWESWGSMLGMIVIMEIFMLIAVAIKFGKDLLKKLLEPAEDEKELLAEIEQYQDVELAACKLAQFDAIKETNGILWIVLGAFLTFAALLIAMVGEPMPPLHRLKGRSPDFVMYYKDCYRKAIRNHKTKLIFVGIGAAFVLGMALVIVLSLIQILLLKSFGVPCWCISLY